MYFIENIKALTISTRIQPNMTSAGTQHGIVRFASSPVGARLAQTTLFIEPHRHGDSWWELLILFAFRRFDRLALNSLLRFPTDTVLFCFCMSEILLIFSSSSSLKIWQLVSNFSHSWILLIVFFLLMCEGMSPVENSPLARACFSLKHGEIRKCKLLGIFFYLGYVIF